MKKNFFLFRDGFFSSMRSAVHIVPTYGFQEFILSRYCSHIGENITSKSTCSHLSRRLLVNKAFQSMNKYLSTLLCKQCI